MNCRNYRCTFKPSLQISLGLCPSPKKTGSYYYPTKKKENPLRRCSFDCKKEKWRMIHSLIYNPFPKEPPNPPSHSSRQEHFLNLVMVVCGKRSETNEMFFCFVTGRSIYFSFFLGRSWLVCPHFFLRQLVALGGRRAFIWEASLVGYERDRQRELGKTNVAFTADHLLAVILGGKSLQRGLNDSTTETKDQVESRLLRSNPTRN